MERNKILIPFDLVVDTDFGLIKLIQEEYRAGIFDKTILDSDDESIKHYLVKRTNPNPLSILTNDKSIDEFYAQFIDQRYQDIFDRSVMTGIGEFCINLMVFSDFELYIQYTNEVEKQFADTIVSWTNNEYAFSIDKNDVIPEDYMSIFAKNVHDLLTYKNLNGINIYLARYAFNLCMKDGKETLAEQKYVIAFLTNILKCIDVYKGILIYDNLEDKNGRTESNDG